MHFLHAAEHHSKTSPCCCRNADPSPPSFSFFLMRQCPYQSTDSRVFLICKVTQKKAPLWQKSQFLEVSYQLTDGMCGAGVGRWLRRQEVPGPLLRSRWSLGLKNHLTHEASLAASRQSYLSPFLLCALLSCQIKRTLPDRLVQLKIIFIHMFF